MKNKQKGLARVDAFLDGFTERVQVQEFNEAGASSEAGSSGAARFIDRIKQGIQEGIQGRGSQLALAVAIGMGSMTGALAQDRQDNHNRSALGQQLEASAAIKWYPFSVSRTVSDPSGSKYIESAISTQIAKRTEDINSVFTAGLGALDRAASSRISNQKELDKARKAFDDLALSMARSPDIAGRTHLVVAAQKVRLAAASPESWREFKSNMSVTSATLAIGSIEVDREDLIKEIVKGARNAQARAQSMYASEISSHKEVLEIHDVVRRLEIDCRDLEEATSNFNLLMQKQSSRLQDIDQKINDLKLNLAQTVRPDDRAVIRLNMDSLSTLRGKVAKPDSFNEILQKEVGGLKQMIEDRRFFVGEDRLKASASALEKSKNKAVEVESMLKSVLVWAERNKGESAWRENMNSHPSYRAIGYQSQSAEDLVLHIKKSADVFNEDSQWPVMAEGGSEVQGERNQKDSSLTDSSLTDSINSHRDKLRG